MKWLVVAALVVGAGCAKCSEKPVVDAGAPVVVAKAPKKFSTDLRTVILTIYPEYRGTAVKSGVARLQRTLKGKTEWQSRTRELFAKHHIAETPADGGIEGTFDLFHFRTDETPTGTVATIELPVDGETLGRLYTNPASLSTLQLGLFLPRENVDIERDVFDFELVYVTQTEHRASFLTRQLVELMQGNGQWKLEGALPAGWEPNPTDGGYGEVPENFTVTLKGVVDGATVTVTRELRRVTVDYRLVTYEP
ncbi:MAG: hypothetical protein ABTQ32_19210 [Myxococcaceae bacterium]